MKSITEGDIYITPAGSASAGTASDGTASDGSDSTGSASTGTASAGSDSTGSASAGSASAGTATIRGNLKSFAGWLRRSRMLFLAKYLSIVFRTRKSAIMGEYDTEAWSDSSLEILKLLENAGARFDISGLNSIRKARKPVVFIGNHMSTLETMILPGLIAPVTDVTFVVKKSLVRHPLFGPVMRSRDPVALDRENPREDFARVMSEGSEILKKGRSVVIFPQGTRNYDFNREEFNTLGVKLAARNDATVIPVALRTDFWKNGWLVKDLGPFDRSLKVYFRFGEPLKAKGREREVQSEVVEFISDNLALWGVRVE
ncbi:MAG: 1-acyl-sn-glycerol-3-phosphate acyltransferase [Bacteroidales bacterium]|nr:1-acyl-sn-glycerol-3-phosphate acyltransferase [Bacteroidales bacterium]